MQFELSGADVIMKQLKDLENIEDIAKEVVDEAVPLLESSLKNRIAEAADRGYATGDLVGSIKGTKAKQNQYGVYAVISAIGNDRKGVNNRAKLSYLEYGVDGKQEARPVLRKACNDVESEVLEKMQAAIERRVGQG